MICILYPAVDDLNVLLAYLSAGEREYERKSVLSQSKSRTLTTKKDLTLQSRLTLMGHVSSPSVSSQPLNQAGLLEINGNHLSL